MNHRFSIILFLAVVGKFGMAGELASVAPQVKIPVKISLIDPGYLLKKNVLVRDGATGEGYDVSCTPIGDVEIVLFHLTQSRSEYPSKIYVVRLWTSQCEYV